MAAGGCKKTSARRQRFDAAAEDPRERVFEELRIAECHRVVAVEFLADVNAPGFDDRKLSLDESVDQGCRIDGFNLGSRKICNPADIAKDSLNTAEICIDDFLELIAELGILVVLGHQLGEGSDGGERIFEFFGRGVQNAWPGFVSGYRGRGDEVVFRGTGTVRGAFRARIAMARSPGRIAGLAREVLGHPPGSATG